MVGVGVGAGCACVMAATAIKVSPMRAGALPELARLRGLYLIKKTGAAGQSAAALEWSALSREHRTVFILLAGLDDNEGRAALKHWGEFPESEADALKSVMRQLVRGVKHLRSVLL